ncbi:MAG TPA: hypothetical protein VKB41_04840 [Steroidobacteraceae bacterium]|nr:hypothetical protein [Steroidobacteraceae bacterium]
MRIASWGHAAFAAILIALGILGLVQGDFMPTLAGIPKGMPGREALIYLCALVCLVCGIGVLFQRIAPAAARVLLIYVLLWLVLVRLTYVVLKPTELVGWWALGDIAVMAAGAWVLYAWFVGDRDGPRFSFAAGESGLRIARLLYGFALIPFGIAHFVYLQETVVLVPGYLPWHVAWAYITGAALFVAGVAILIGVYARLAASLSALEMGLFTVLVWIPIVTASPNPFQWTEFINSCTLTAGAWLVADSYRGLPWLSVGRRVTAQASA